MRNRKKCFKIDFEATKLHFLLGHTECVDRLLRAGAKINARSSEGFAPLLLATQFGKVDTLNRLLKEKKIDLHVKTNKGSSAMDLAERKENREVIEKNTRRW